MPYLDFATLDDEDVKSIVVYLRTIPPVKNAVPTRQLPGPLEYIVKTIPKPLTTPQPSHPSVDAGRARQVPGDDRGLRGVPHARRTTRASRCRAWTFGGGGMFKDPVQNDKRCSALNITPDPSGIAHYDEALFMQTMRTGQVAGPHAEPHHAVRVLQEHDRRRPAATSSRT